MMKVHERLNIILALDKLDLDLSLLKEFDSGYLQEVCVKIESMRVPQEWYSGYKAIQKELCDNQQFFFYLSKIMAMEDASLDSVNELLSVLHMYGESALDYPVDCLISSMFAAIDTGKSGEIFYDYIKNFTILSSDSQGARVALTNLGLYREALSKPIAELSALELALFTEESLTDRRLLPNEKEIDHAFHLLASYVGLLDIIRFFYKNDIAVNLCIDDYRALCLNTIVIHEALEVLNSKLNEINMKLLIKRWQNNNCLYHDLMVMIEHMDSMDNDAYKKVLDSHCAYVNFIYGSFIKNIPLSEIFEYMNDILIYATVYKKKGFIRLIEDNYEEFSRLNPNSILFRREFYTVHFNINTLNANNLRDCGWMTESNMNLSALEKDRQYTFAEIKALYGMPLQYYRFYAAMEILSVDKRLIVFKQLSKRNLLKNTTNEEDICKLAYLLSQKPLTVWREQHFSHITGLKPQDEIALLICWDVVQKHIPQMVNRVDAILVTRNPFNAKDYDLLDDVKNNMINVDASWGRLVGCMGFTDDFLCQHKEHIIEFLSQNGADIADTYYSGLKHDTQREAFKRIVKAVLMGGFTTLKYYADDLMKELDYPITDAQKSIWMDNSTINGNGGIFVKECDDFYGTMLLGEMPQHTCLSYINGGANDCLLSGFDSNKKVIYAYNMDDDVIGRAIIRLTKGRFEKQDKPNETSLSFIDLEATSLSPGNATCDTLTNKANGEHLILFLERPYISGVSDKTKNFIYDMFVELVAKKAESIGAMLVLTNPYVNISHEGYVRTTFHVYISKSKAGAQYLDSLNGSASVSDEGGYKSNSFYIHKDVLRNVA